MRQENCTRLYSGSVLPAGRQVETSHVFIFQLDRCKNRSGKVLHAMPLWHAWDTSCMSWAGLVVSAVCATRHRTSARPWGTRGCRLGGCVRHGQLPQEGST